MSEMLDPLFEGLLEWLARRWPWRRVPDVRGKTLDECELVLDEFDLVLHVGPDAGVRGLVTSQQPRPRSRVRRWSAVLVTVEEP